MQIAPTGGGPVGAEVAAIEVGLAKDLPELGPLPAAPAHASSHAPVQQVPQIHVADTAVLHELAPADLPKLMQIVAPTPVPERAVQLDHVLQQAGRAVAEGKIEEAVGHLAEAVAVDPKRVAELSSMPELAPIRTEVDQLVNRLTNVAKMDAEVKLGQAEQAITESAGLKMPQEEGHWESRPETLLQVAHGLFAAGGYANYVRSADLAQEIQSAYWGATIIEPQVTKLEEQRLSAQAEPGKADPRGAALRLARQSWQVTREKLPPRVQKLWQRAPLLVLLLGWLLLGITGGLGWLALREISPETWTASSGDLGFEIWGLGFLALVGFGFYARVRNER